MMEKARNRKCTALHAKLKVGMSPDPYHHLTYVSGLTDGYLHVGGSEKADAMIPDQLCDTTRLDLVEATFGL